MTDKPKRKSPWLIKYQFKKGQAPNPRGSSQLARDKAEVKRNLTKKQIKNVISKYMNMSMKELGKILKNENTNMHEAIIIKLILKARKNPTVPVINFLYDRTAGKVKEEIEISEGHGELVDYIAKAQNDNGGNS